MRLFLTILFGVLAAEVVAVGSPRTAREVAIAGCTADTSGLDTFAVYSVSVRDRDRSTRVFSDSTGFYRLTVDSAALPMRLEFARIGYRTEEHVVAVASQRLVKMPLIVLAAADDLHTPMSDAERQRHLAAWERERRQLRDSLRACKRRVEALVPPAP